MKLNLGCGKDIRLGYHNFDIDKSIKDDNVYPQDVSNLNNVMILDEKHIGRYINDGEVEEINALHIIEYFTPQELQEVMKNWASKLKIGGKIYLKSWDYKLIANHVVYNRIEINSLNNMIFGSDPNIPSRGFFDMLNIIQLLETIGFTINEKLYRDYEFFITAEKVRNV